MESSSFFVISFLVPAFVAIVWCVVIFLEGKLYKVQRYGGILLLLFAVCEMLCGLSYATQLHYSFLLEMACSVCLAIIPTQYLIYISRKTTLIDITNNIRLSLLLPALVLVLYIILGISATADDRMLHMKVVHGEAGGGRFSSISVAYLSYFLGNVVRYLIAVWAACAMGRGIQLKARFFRLLNETFVDDNRSIRDYHQSIALEVIFGMFLLFSLMGPLGVQTNSYMLVAGEAVLCAGFSLFGSHIMHLSYGAEKVTGMIKAQLQNEEAGDAIHVAEYLSTLIQEGRNGMSSSDDGRITNVIPIEKFEEVESSKYYIDPKISLIMLARVMGVSAPSLIYSLHYHYNCNFSDFIKNKRVRYAKELMELHRYPNVSAIASEVGYMDVLNFVSDFEKVYAVTPRAYMGN